MSDRAGACPTNLTCGAGSRGSASLPVATASANQIGRTPANLFAPTINDGIGHRVTDCFVAHPPLELINPVVVLLVKFPLHCVGNFRSRHRTPNSRCDIFYDLEA